MPMIPDDEIERIKRETDLAAVVRSRGIALTPQGGDLIGLCPFHKDENPSLHVTPAKRLWRCVSCGATGNVIQFVQRFDGISFPHAAELLKDGASAYKAAPTCGPVKKSTVPKLANPLAGVASAGGDAAAEHAADQEALRRVVDYYHERLAANPSALAYLAKRGLDDTELIAAFRLGYCDRTLGLRLPYKNRKEGAALRARLARLGVMRDTGHEHFRGRIVFPVIAEDGTIGTLYGRAAGDVDKHERHRFLPGPQNGVWNPSALGAAALSQSKGEIILTEGIIDALTWHRHGWRNVTTCYSARQPSSDVLDAIVKAGVRVACLAFNPDGAGDTGTASAAALLLARGVECRRVRFPHGHDANSYALAVTPPRQALAVLLNAAEFIGKGRAVGPAPADAGASGLRGGVVDPFSAAASSCVAPASSSLAAKAAKAAEATPANTAQTPPPPPEAAKDEARQCGNGHAAGVAPERSAGVSPGGHPLGVGANNKITVTSITASGVTLVSLTRRGEHWCLDLTDPAREYRLGGLDKLTGFEALKLTVRLKVGQEGPGGTARYHLDQIDLARDAERRRFVERAAEETGLHADLLKRDLGQLLLAAENFLAARAAEAAAQAARPAAPAMDELLRAQALELLRDPRLLDRILADFAACGLVGEETNKLVGYLAAVSRLLNRPLAVIVRATTAAGKSSLMDAILALVPPEHRIKYSALTGQALYYLGDADLKHKILAIVEEEGAEKASYALKLLQSEGELSIASTGKDPHTGRMVTQEYRVEGPVMILLTTTAVDLDEELLNRCIVLTVDESREQTAAIHVAQRRAETLAGLVEDERRERLLALHRAAQRLLRPLQVVNPFAEKLTFLDDRTRTRRDHKKYLTLIRAVALLHQHQRAVRTMTEHGHGVEYIEATLDDIAAANRLAHDVLGRTLDEMPPQTRRLLALIQAMETSRAAAVVGGWRRRDLRAFTGWSDTALKVHLARLVELEYVLPRRDPEHLQALRYELLFDGDAASSKPHLCGLYDVEKLRAECGYDPNRSGQKADRSGSGQPLVSPRSGGGQGAENADSPSEKSPGDPETAENARPRDAENAAA